MAQGRHSVRRRDFELPKGPGELDEVGEGFDPFDGLDMPEEAPEGVEGTTFDDVELAGEELLDAARELDGRIGMRPYDEDPHTALATAAEGVDTPAGEDAPAPEDTPVGKGASSLENDFADEPVGAHSNAPATAGDEDAAAAEGADAAPAAPRPSLVARLRANLRVVVVGALVLVLLAGVGVFAYLQTNQPPDTAGQSFLHAIARNDASTTANMYAGDFEALEDAFADALPESAGLGTAEQVRSRLNDSQKAAFDSSLAKLRTFSLSAQKWGQEEDKAFVDFEVSAFELGAMYQELMRDYLAESMEEVFKNDKPESESSSSQRFVRLLDEKARALTGKTHVATARLYLHHEGFGWKVDELSPEALDALTGGLASQVAAAKAQL